MSTEPSFCRTQCNERAALARDRQAGRLGSVSFDLQRVFRWCVFPTLLWGQNIETMTGKQYWLYLPPLACTVLSQPAAAAAAAGRQIVPWLQAAAALQRCRNCSAAAVMTLQLHRRDQYDFPGRCWPGTRSHHCSRHHNSGSQRTPG